MPFLIIDRPRFFYPGNAGEDDLGVFQRIARTPISTPEYRARRPLLCAATPEILRRERTGKLHHAARMGNAPIGALLKQRADNDSGLFR